MPNDQVDMPNEHVSEVDLNEFDLQITGCVSGRTGVVPHRVKFNAYAVIRSHYDALGDTPSEAVLVHDALQFVNDQTRVAALADVAKPKHKFLGVLFRHSTW